MGTDRPAHANCRNPVGGGGVGTPEVEVTQEMIEAGIECLDRGPLAGAASAELAEQAVVEIYRVMARVAVSR